MRPKEPEIITASYPYDCKGREEFRFTNMVTFVNPVIAYRTYFLRFGDMLGSSLYFHFLWYSRCLNSEFSSTSNSGI